jgi:ABC-type branched-subunit amino acid transport system permease subunit
MLRPDLETRKLLLKWVVAVLVPLSIFTLVWSGEGMLNSVFLTYVSPQESSYTAFTWSTLIQTTIFLLVLYPAFLMLGGYLVAADSGRRSMYELWADVIFVVTIPLLICALSGSTGLIMGLAISVPVWAIYLFLRPRVHQWLHYTPPPPLAEIEVLDEGRKQTMLARGTAGGFWIGLVFSVVMLVADIIYYLSGALNSSTLWLWIAIRTIVFPIAGYFLGYWGGRLAVHHTFSSQVSNEEGKGATRRAIWRKQQQLETLSTERKQEEARDFVPHDLPFMSKGAKWIYSVLIIAFVLFYPALDPLLFGFGMDGRLTGYNDAGYYVILALGLNIVVGFAGLLDLGYVAFFAIGAYIWGLVGSPQLQVLLSIPIAQATAGWLFWPMLIIGAIIVALWGVALGAPTLRLRGDYLAIVTLGFGEIIPVVFLELDMYTNGANGLIGIFSPNAPGVDWSSITPVPYYYLIMALIVFTIFANVRLRDSRLGRAWIAIREDEIAASSSGINLTKTKLLAFAAGAFFAGIAGMYKAAKLGSVTPDNFSFGDSIIYLAMVVIGGLGSIPGVILGAIAVYAINVLVLAQLDTLASNPTNPLHVLHAIPGLSSLNNIRGLIFGVLLVAIMLYRPEGLWPSSRRKRELHHTENKPEEDVGALETAPGSPDFEQEVRVE